jgi:MoaA/NifB/PqqE/SkfB family radical SAM enzyme
MSIDFFQSVLIRANITKLSYEDISELFGIPYQEVKEFAVDYLSDKKIKPFSILQMQKKLAGKNKKLAAQAVVRKPRKEVKEIVKPKAKSFANTLLVKVDKKTSICIPEGSDPVQAIAEYKKRMEAKIPPKSKPSQTIKNKEDAIRAKQKAKYPSYYKE